MDCFMTLEEILEGAKRTFVWTDEGWVARVDGIEVVVSENVDGAHATVGTGVYSKDDNYLALRAMANYLEGWVFEEGDVYVPREGEVTITCTRPVYLLCDPDCFVEDAVRLLKSSEDALGDVAEGDRLSNAVHKVKPTLLAFEKRGMLAGFDDDCV